MASWKPHTSSRATWKLSVEQSGGLSKVVQRAVRPWFSSPSMYSALPSPPPTMMESTLPAMNMEVFLELRWKCRAERKGDRRLEGSAAGLSTGRLLSSELCPSVGASSSAGSSLLWALMEEASSGWRITTHSYLSISGFSLKTKHSPVPKKLSLFPPRLRSSQSVERKAPHTSASQVRMSSRVGSYPST